jgi:hypothetical protein
MRVYIIAEWSGVFVSTETGWLRDRIGKDEPPCPLLRLAAVQSDTSDGNFLDGNFGTGIGPATTNDRTRRGLLAREKVCNRLS